MRRSLTTWRRGLTDAIKCFISMRFVERHGFVSWIRTGVEERSQGCRGREWIISLSHRQNTLQCCKSSMATAALEVVKQEGYKMGLPSDDQAGQLNHNSEVVTAPQNMELEMQMSGQTPSSKVPPDVDQDGSLEAEANQKTEAPKKKTPGRKRKGESVARTPQQRDDSSLLDTAELTSSGRPKRRAAKIALDYLQNLAKEMTAPLESLNNATSKPEEEEEGGSPQKKKPRKEKGTKKKLARTSSDIDDDDEDFAPEKEQETEEEESEEEEEADLVVEKSFNVVRRGKRAGYSKCLLPNGLPSNIMEPIWNCFSRNKDFRDENFSPWVFPEWIPSANDWDSLSEREAEKYLPEEKVSSSFTFTREKVKEPIVLQTMNRFESMPYHPERWDSMFFVGGPVHSMEWCPCPDGAAKTQYAAIYCHKGMDDLHKVNQLYSSPALLQLWEVGSLQSKRPSTAPHLAYALAIDEGFIWNMKWCPSGTWELPSTCRKVGRFIRFFSGITLNTL
ncbi:hypothetical protein DNTS_028486 [Danionella cerebrum]|uniref:Uncharacterized protein n=1 Tax=Danionella cerebrum TaxID=2873325 RepID=A0A553R7I1_9TELE|nr:hypothetical protein DNTS_028486 [Danionella translucida]